MCQSVLVDRDLEGRALALAPFVQWSLSHLLMWFRRPVTPLGSRIVGCYLDCEWRPITLSDGGITTIISIYCKDRRGISTDPRGEWRPGAESEVCKRFLGCQSDVHQTHWISPTNHDPHAHPESEGTRVFIAFWGRGAGPWCNDGACASHNYSSTWNSTFTHGWVLFLAPSESLSTGPAGGATKERNCGGWPQLVPPWHPPLDSGRTPSYGFITWIQRYKNAIINRIILARKKWQWQRTLKLKHVILTTAGRPTAVTT